MNFDLLGPTALYRAAATRLDGTMIFTGLIRLCKGWLAQREKEMIANYCSSDFTMFHTRVHEMAITNRPRLLITKSAALVALWRGEIQLNSVDASNEHSTIGDDEIDCVDHFSG